jgi:RNA polymerase sigma factor for flagellar operon FliA
MLRMSQSSREGTNLSLEHRYRNRHGNGGDGFATLDTLAAADDASANSLRIAMKQDVRDWVVKGLSRRHRLIVLLYYYEDMSMREIGESLGMSESRISQVHATVIERLQRRLRDRGEELAAVA